MPPGASGSVDLPAGDPAPPPAGAASPQLEHEREANQERPAWQRIRERHGAEASDRLEGGLVEERVRRRADHPHVADAAGGPDPHVQLDGSLGALPARCERIYERLLNALPEAGQVGTVLAGHGAASTARRGPGKR